MLYTWEQADAALAVAEMLRRDVVLMHNVPDRFGLLGFTKFLTPRPSNVWGA